MPRKHHPKNERAKRAYLGYLEEAKGKTRASANDAAAAIADFEAVNNWKDFAAFHIEQARRYKRVLEERAHQKTGKPLSKSTIYSRMMALRAFFAWLAEQPGYKSRIKRTDCDYFQPTANDARIATARRDRPAPDMQTVRRLVQAMPADTDVQKRDRALIAFALLSGARVDAIASLNLGHVDLERRTVFQDARMVRTKNRKTFRSGFFPVGADFELIVADWIKHLKDNLHYGPDDPLFPSTRMAVGPRGGFEVAGLEQRHWDGAAAIRRIFRAALTAHGLPYFNPHLLRKTITRMGQTSGLTQEEEKSWSQNLGHEHLRTTTNSYGQIPEHRQIELMDGLRHRAASPALTGVPDAATVKWVVDYLASKVGMG
jgi:integrase